MSDTINWADMHKFATTALEGEFSVVVVEATAAKTADQSKDMIKYKVKIESGPFVDRPITGQFVISPDSAVAMRIMFSHWAILGIGADFFAKNPNASIQQIADALVGRRAVVVVGQRNWNGRTFDDVKEWKSALGGPGGGVQPLGSGLSGVLGGSAGGPQGGLTAGPGAPQATPVSSPSVSSPADSAAPFAPASPIAEQPSTPPPNRPF